MSTEYISVYLCLQFLQSMSCSFKCIDLSPPWLNLFHVFYCFDAFANCITFLIFFFPDSFLLQTAMDLYVLILYPVTLLKLLKSPNNISVLYDLYMSVTQFCCASKMHSGGQEISGSSPDSTQHLCLCIKSYCNRTYQSLSIIYNYVYTISTLLST